MLSPMQQPSSTVVSCGSHTASTPDTKKQSPDRSHASRVSFSLHRSNLRLSSLQQQPVSSVVVSSQSPGSSVNTNSQPLRSQPS